MTRLDRQLKEAAQCVLRPDQSPAHQLWLGLPSFFVDSIGFFQVCHLADATRQAISHQHRMYYREEFNLWYATIDAYLRDRQVPAAIRTFLTDSTWNECPPPTGPFWFPTMHEVVFLSYIMEMRGYPVWTAERCEAFYYGLNRRPRRKRRMRHPARVHAGDKPRTTPLIPVRSRTGHPAVPAFIPQAY